MDELYVYVGAGEIRTESGFVRHIHQRGEHPNAKPFKASAGWVARHRRLFEAGRLLRITSYNEYAERNGLPLAPLAGEEQVDETDEQQSLVVEEQVDDEEVQVEESPLDAILSDLDYHAELRPLAALVAELVGEEPDGQKTVTLIEFCLEHEAATREALSA